MLNRVSSHELAAVLDRGRPIVEHSALQHRMVHFALQACPGNAFSAAAALPWTIATLILHDPSVSREAGKAAPGSSRPPRVYHVSARPKSVRKAKARASAGARLGGRFSNLSFARRFSKRLARQKLGLK